MSTSDPTRAQARGTPPPVKAALEQPFDAAGLIALRSALAAHAADLGLRGDRVDELILLAHELASNAILHGGGGGRLRLWTAGGDVYCEVSDDGPGLPAGVATGRDRPPLGATGGRGLWLVRLLADELDLRSGPTGTTVTAVVRPVTGS
jgi:anti-sigma regulatory factor (Ser/Thr protein kinase)